MNRPVPVSPKRTHTQSRPLRPSTLHHQETNSSTSSAGSDSTDDPSRNLSSTPGAIPLHHLPTPALGLPPTSSPQPHPHHTPHHEVPPFSVLPAPLPPHHIHRRISPVLPSPSDSRTPSILIPSAQRPPPLPLPPASAATASALPADYNQYTPGGGGSEMMNPMSIAAALVATARDEDTMMGGPSHGPGRYHTDGLGSGSARSGSSGSRYYNSTSHAPNNDDDVASGRGIPGSWGPPPFGSSGGGFGAGGSSNHSSRHSSGSPGFSRPHLPRQQQRQHHHSRSHHEQPLPGGQTEQDQQAQRLMQQYGMRNLSPEDTRHIVEELRGLERSLHHANSEQRKLVDETMREWGGSDDGK